MPVKRKERGRFAYPWYIMVDDDLVAYAEYRKEETGESRNAMVRTAIREIESTGTVMGFQEWKKGRDSK